MPTCPICSKEMKYINNSHLKSHNLTPTEFKAMYPEVEAIPQEIREANKRNSVLGGNKSSITSLKKYNDRIAKYNLNPKKCLKCDSLIPYEKRANQFCSTKCSASLNGGKVACSEEGKKAQRESGLKHAKNLLLSKSRTKGYTYNDKLCVICHNKFSVYYATKNKKACSEKCLKVLRGINNSKRYIKTFGNCGYYEGIYCASSWELAFLIYNLDLGKDIKRCDLNFSYIMGEETKTYFPDFLMENTIYEVKGRELEDVALKTQAVIDAGYKIELIRKKEITPIIKFLKEKYSFKCVTELYDKKI